MSPSENQIENNQPDILSQKKIIQPINAEEVKTYIRENESNTPQNIPATPTLIPSPIQPATQDPKTESNTTNADEEDWHPNKPLANRIPRLKNYAIFLILGSLFFMFINRWTLKFSNQKGVKILGIIVYSFLAIMLISGLIMLYSKSKRLVQLSMNIMITLTVLFGIIFVLSFNIILIIFTVIAISSLITTKSYVKRAA